MDDYKGRIKGAIGRYITKQDKKAEGPKRKNDKPEKRVEKACLEWMRNRGWTVDIYESKATYNPKIGRYIAQSMKAGNTDCMGTLPYGVGVYVEFKAPGKLASYNNEKNYRQRAFVREKIASGGFACVTDSVERLAEIFTQWEAINKKGKIEAAKTYLISMLPRRKKA